MAQPFIPPSRHGTHWSPVGHPSSFPDISESGTISLSEPHHNHQQQCGSTARRGCKVFLISETTASDPIELSGDPAEQIDPSLRKGEQVLVFRYKGRFYAMDNKCPHSSYPLSNGIPFDIEDFGVVLSAGITCPKHGWQFDLVTGNADRGSYRLKLWEVQVRSGASGSDDDGRGKGGEEVWVRKKQRIG